MSIRFPDTAAIEGNGAGLRFDIPVNSGRKVQNSGFVAAFFFRTRSSYNTDPRTLGGRGTGGLGGNEGQFFLDGTDSKLQARLYRSGSNCFAGPAVPTGPDKTYLAIFSISATGKHIALCEPAGTPTTSYVVHNTNNPWSNSTFSNYDIISSIGGGSAAKSWWGPLEEVCLWQGCFPETATDVLDATLIRAIASGAQDLDTLHTLLTAGGSAAPVERRFRYRLRDKTDLADAFGIAGNLTVVNENSGDGRLAYPSGPLRPTSLMPDRVAHGVAQVTFGQAGVGSTAFATIRTPGGAFAGITPARIEARLIKEDGSALRDWTVVDAAPSAGRWAVGALTNVPMTVGWLGLGLRAVNGGGTVLAETWSHGLVAAGFNTFLSSQSQAAVLFTTQETSVSESIALPSGFRGAFQRVFGGADNGATAVYTDAMVSAAGTANVPGRGARQAMLEIHNRFPGVPVQFGLIGHEGTPVHAFYTGTGADGSHAWKWAALKTFLGVVQPFYLMLMQHSEGSNASYGTHLANMIDFGRTNLGEPIKILHVSVSRYKAAGAISPGNNADDVRWARNAARAYCIANPGYNLWMGSWSALEVGATEADGATSGHPPPTDKGMGRSGGMMGWAMMSAARAVPDVPIGISKVRAEGAAAVIEFGPVG